MRTLRLSLTGTVILALLAGLSGAVVAQDTEAESTEPTGVFVTLSDYDWVSEGEWRAEPGVAYSAGDGIAWTETWEATDPRLSGAGTYRGTWHHYEPLETALTAFEWQVVNDEGSWSGTGHGIGSPDATYGEEATVVLVGDGAYEGLTAYISFDMPEMDTARGIIIADELPPFPEPATTVAAREEPAPATSGTGTAAPAVFVTGTVTEAYTYDVGSSGRQTFSDDLRGFEVTGGGLDLMRQVVEWSDPRLPTDLWLALDYTLIRDGADGSGGALNNATRSVLEDEAGRWVGNGRYVIDADQAFSFYELTGEGAYEGLHALMRGVPVADAQGPWDMAY